MKNNLPEKVSEAWEQRMGSAVFSTTDKYGNPNAIYVNSIRKFNESLFIIADNYFDKTRKNIQDGSKGSILFQAGEVESYQIKGSLQYHTDGIFYDNMKQWNKTKHPGHAAVVLEVEDVYEGGVKLM